MSVVVAVNKPVTMSSDLDSPYNASYAVDNVTVCHTHHNIAHTKNQFRPWIKIDLRGIYNVHSVVIYNRQDGYGKCINILGHRSESLRCSNEIGLRLKSFIAQSASYLKFLKEKTQLGHITHPRKNSSAFNSLMTVCLILSRDRTRSLKQVVTAPRLNPWQTM